MGVEWSIKNGFGEGEVGGFGGISGDRVGGENRGEGIDECCDRGYEENIWGYWRAGRVERVGIGVDQQR